VFGKTKLDVPGYRKTAKQYPHHAPHQTGDKQKKGF
jgi:hypothetical protein